MSRPVRTAVLLLFAALALAACGKKADLRAPDGEAAAYTYPQPYPSPRSVVPGGETAGDYPPAFEGDRAPDEGRTKRAVTGPS
jgi:predicted small lipoprotein YifL